MFKEKGLNMVELPHGYTEKECIWDNLGNQVTNGTIRLLGYYKLMDNNSSQQLLFVHFSTHNGSTDTIVEIPVSVINSKKLFNYVPDGFLFFNDSETKRLRFFQNLLTLTMDKMPLYEMYTIRSGYNRLPNEKYVYSLGNRILNQNHDKKFLLKNINQSKLINFVNDNQNYTNWIHIFFKQSDNHPALFISSTVSLIRPLLIADNINTLFALYLVGETGKGKSEYAKLLADIFMEHDNCRSLSSKQQDLYHRMGKHNDFLFLIDDLNKTDSPRVKDKKEAILAELIQLISSGGSTESKEEIICVNTILLITAEYMLKNPSSINRCLVIELSDNFNADDLTWLQNNHFLYINFLIDYITWICQNYSILTDYIRRLDANIMSFAIEEPQAYAGFARISRTHKTLQIAEEIYLRFLKEHLHFPDPILNQWRKQISLSINNCISITLEAVKKADTNSGTHYLMVILDIFLQDFNNYVANTYKEYQKSRRIVTDRNRQHKCIHRRPPLDKKIFFRENNQCYCIRGNDLLEIFTAKDNFEYVVSKKAISAQLKYHGLLKCSGGEYSFPSNVSDGSKTRYYHLYIARIVELMKEYIPEEKFDAMNYLSPLPEINPNKEL